MTATPTAGPCYLPPEHPKFPEFEAARQLEPDQRVHQCAAQLIATLSPAALDDQAACDEHLRGISAASVLQTLLKAGKSVAEQHHLPVAEQAKDDLVATNDQIEETIRRRASLAEEVVGAKGHRISRRGNRVHLSQDQEIAGRRELAGDIEHRYTPGAGWIGIAIGTIVAIIETVVTLRIFNVSLTSVGVTALPWAALTVGLAIFNERVPAMYLGPRRRHAREARRAAVELNTAALDRARQPVGGHRGVDPGSGRIAGAAPPAHEVRRARREMHVATGVYTVPLALLLTGVYARLLAYTDRLTDLGLFRYLFPAIAAAVLAALLWALVVEPWSRGNTLGDRLRSERALDLDSTVEDDSLRARGHTLLVSGRQYAELAHASLIAYHEELTEMAEIGQRAIQLAAVVLAVTTVGPVRPANIGRLSLPQRDRVADALATEQHRAEQLQTRLDDAALPLLPTGDSPHAVLSPPPSLSSDPGYVDHRANPTYPPTTLTDHHDSDPGNPLRTRGYLLLVAALLAAVLATAAVAWITLG